MKKQNENRNARKAIVVALLLLFLVCFAAFAAHKNKVPVDGQEKAALTAPHVAVQPVAQQASALS